jgi:hypothetical protein
MASCCYLRGSLHREDEQRRRFADQGQRRPAAEEIRDASRRHRNGPLDSSADLRPGALLRHARPEDIELRTDRLSPIGVDLRYGQSRIVDEVLAWAECGSSGIETGGYLYGRRLSKALNRLDGPRALETLEVEFEFVAYPGPDTDRRAQSVKQDVSYARAKEQSPSLKRQGWRLIGDYHSHPARDTVDGLPSRADQRSWFRSLQLLADKSGPAAWRLSGSETAIDAWLGIIVTRSAGGSWAYPKLHAWITRLDRDRIVCEPAALEIA